MGRLKDFLGSKRVLTLSVGAILVATLGLFVFTLSDAMRGPRDANWERIQANGFIVVGVDPSIPPFGQDTPQGPIGLDPALARELGQRLGVEVRFVLLSFDGLYDALLLGHVDMVIAALRPDPFRTDRVRYTQPYFDAGQSLVSLEGYTDLAALEGGRIAVEFASEGDMAARQHGLEIARYFTAGEALAAAEQGEVDAAFVDRISAYLYFSGEDTALRLAPQVSVPDPYVIAIRRSDWRLFRAVEDALLTMQGDGTLNGLIQTWLRDSATPP